jgi:hypothetical protein
MDGNDLKSKKGGGARKQAVMPAAQSTGRGKDWFWLVLLLVTPILLFPRLGDSCLWQDEAETALLGKAILAHGYPLATTGSNIITDQPDRADLNASGIWIWTPWLQNYLAALSFALLGISTLSARLPFALAGWGVILAQYAALKDITRNLQLSRCAAVLLLASVPFLLHVRQCRYYVLLILFTIVHLWGYVRLTRRDSHGTILFIVGGTGLFYSWYPQLAVSFLALSVHSFIYHRNAAVLRRLAAGWAFIAGISLPFFLYSRGWSRDYLGSGHNYEDLWRYLAGLRAYLLQVHAYAWPGLLAFPLLWKKSGSPGAAIQRAKRNRIAIFTLVWFVASCFPPGPWALAWMGIALAALGVEIYVYLKQGLDRPASTAAMRAEYALLIIYLAVGCLVIAGLSPYPFYRYYLGLLPLFVVLTAATVLELASGRRWIAGSLAACLIFCNLLSLGPFSVVTSLAEVAGLASKESYFGEFGYPPNNNNAALTLRISESFPRFQSMPWKYIQEVTHEYVGPITGVVRYLRSNANSNETMLVTYEQFPLMFYTDLKVYSAQAGKDIPECPDWVLIHGPSNPTLPEKLIQALRNPAQYQRANVDVHEYAWENAPEPSLHQYLSPNAGPLVILFHRVGPGPAQ